MEETTRPAATCADRYRIGSARLGEALARARREALKPPPNLTLSEWADRYAYLSPETSASSGKFKAFGYQNGILDAVTDPTVKQVCVIKSARVGFTKILDHVAGYFVHQDPSPVLIVQPRVEDAEDYSRTEIAPMLRDTPVLAEIAGDLKAKDSNQRILKRVFRNGSSLSFVGANSPGGFRRITARIVVFDEVDGYPPQGAGDEGDQIMLGTKRSETFWNRKIILGSTPTVKGVSRIEKAWDASDQRRYFVPCPHCGHKQTLKWGGKDAKFGIKWRLGELGDVAEAWYVCEANGCIIEEHHKPWMIDSGEWIASKPFRGHAGFHIWAGYSLFPNASWDNLVTEWLRVQEDRHLLKTFVNLVLGETWEDAGESVDQHRLMDRCEGDWGIGVEDPAPEQVLAVTLGVDVQPDRLEIERIGWGVGEESWSLDYLALRGDPSAPLVWNELDEYRSILTLTKDGRALPVSAVAIDTGGANTQAVCEYVRPRQRSRVYGIKGSSVPGQPVWPKRATRNNKGRIDLYPVGVDTAKDAIYSRLRIEKPGPGYCHFPKGRDPEYFDQLTGETVVTKWVKGRPRRVWQPRRKRVEALDCRVYGYAALLSLNLAWAREVKRAAVAPRTHLPVRDDEMDDVVQPHIAPDLSEKKLTFTRRATRSSFMAR